MDTAVGRIVQSCTGLANFALTVHTVRSAHTLDRYLAKYLASMPVTMIVHVSRLHWYKQIVHVWDMLPAP